MRVAVLIVSPLELYPDEAQYWFWAQTPALGYFSKPPMIGWIVWLTTTIFGNAEWAIRLSSPLLHAGTALFIYGIAKRLSDSRVGMWSALAYHHAAGALLFLRPRLDRCAAALLLVDGALRLHPRARREGLALADPVRHRPRPRARVEIRHALFRAGRGARGHRDPQSAQAGGERARACDPADRCCAALTEHLVELGAWLSRPSRHTEANADWSHARYNIASALTFLGGQFGVFGPVMMVAFIASLWKLARARDDRDLLLAAFSVPPILIIAVQAFISEANANWAATAYVAATPLAIGAMLSTAKRWPLYLSLGFDCLVMVVLWIIAVSPAHRPTLIGQGNAFKREEGWRKLCLRRRRGSLEPALRHHRHRQPQPDRRDALLRQIRHAADPDVGQRCP